MSLREEGIQFEYAVRNLFKDFQQLTDKADNDKKRTVNYYEISLSQEGINAKTTSLGMIIIIADKKELKVEELSFLCENTVFRVRFQLMEQGKNQFILHFVDWKAEYSFTMVEKLSIFKLNPILKGETKKKLPEEEVKFIIF